jgi:hypothetical protein
MRKQSSVDSTDISESMFFVEALERSADTAKNQGRPEDENTAYHEASFVLEEMMRQNFYGKNLSEDDKRFFGMLLSRVITYFNQQTVTPPQ